MNKKSEILACEIENLIIQYEKKKNTHKEHEIEKLIKEDEKINFDKLSMTECHVIDCISSLKEANGINIAQILKMTRGGISKIASRLIDKELIITYKDEANQKKVLYKLTPLGEKINMVHNNLHIENHNKLCAIADKYTSQEQDIIIRFFNDIKNNNI